MSMKYIIFEGDTCLEFPVIFPDWIGHDTMARTVRYHPVSAGFVRIENDQYYAYGESISLSIKARVTEDTNIINKMNRGY